MNLTKAYKNYTKKDIQGLAESTIEDRIQRLKPLIKMFGDKEVDKLTKNDLDSFISQQKNYKPSSINQTIIRINGFINYLYNGDLIDHSRSMKLKLKKISYKKEEKELPLLNHLLRTIDSFPQDKQDFCHVVLSTGISWAELCNLTIKDYDDKYIYITKSKNVHRERVIRINRYIYNILQRNKKTANGAKLFPSAPNFRHWLKRNLTHKDARFTPNLLRHIFITKMSSKVELNTLQEMVGHARGSICTNKYYVHTNNNLKEKEYLSWQKKIKKPKGKPLIFH